MPGFQPKITRYKKGKIKQFKETEQASEPDSDMAGMLELSDHEFKTTMTNMLKTLMGKVDKMQEQMCNVNRDRHFKNQKEMLENKNTVIEIKSAFHGLISRLTQQEESLSLRICQ